MGPLSSPLLQRPSELINLIIFLHQLHRQMSFSSAYDSILILSACIALALYLHRPTPEVEWKKKDGSQEETSGRPDKHNRWFHFKSIGLNDDGEYECKAWNSHGFTTHSFTVTVEGQHGHIVRSKAGPHP